MFISIRHAEEGELPTRFHDVPEGVPHYTAFDIMKPLRVGYKPNELPSRLDIPVYVNYQLKTGEVDIRRIPIYLDTEDANYAEVNLLQLVLSVELPRIDNEACIQTLVDALKREKQKVLADAQMKVNELDNRIGDLLAITYQPA